MRTVWVNLTRSDFLADHVRALGAQRPPGAAQVGLDLTVAGLVFLALVVCLRRQRGGAPAMSVMVVISTISSLVPSRWGTWYSMTRT